MTETVVFLGPSLDVATARSLLPAATYLPPASMGDIYRAVSELHPDRVVLVDGVFHCVPAVWHKEIVYALSRGIEVLGAASMGALRAAELHTFGMRGVGWVFDRYRCGDLTDDDEVAIMHADAEHGYRSLSTAMVNLRAGLDRARDEGVIGEPTRRRLLDLGKRRPYRERSWRQLRADARSAGLDAGEMAALAGFVEAARPDVKRADACAVLATVAGTAPEPPAPGAVAFVPTVFWDKMAGDEMTTGGARQEDLCRLIRATEPQLDELLRTSLLMHLAQRWCKAEGVEVTQDDVDTAFRRFRRQHGLLAQEQVNKWLARSGLSLEELRDVVLAQARVVALLRRLRPAIDAGLPAALAWTDRLAAVRQRLCDAQTSAADRPKVTGGAATALRLYGELVRDYCGSADDLVDELGLRSVGELIAELISAYPGWSGETPGPA